MMFFCLRMSPVLFLSQQSLLSSIAFHSMKLSKVLLDGAQAWTHRVLHIVFGTSS